MANYSIKDLEKLSGIKAHTIRIWEKRYNLINPNRTQTNIRFYSDSELRRLLNISILVLNGFKISKIAQLDNNEICEKVLLYSQNSFFPENLIENLTISMIDFDEIKFDRLISNQILKLGFEETFLKVLHPFMERIGMLWQAGSILPSHEHFISNLIRQKLIVAIESHNTQQQSNQKNTFVLFLPEGEWHELGLLFYQYLLKKHGFQTLYLGQSVPLSDLDRLVSVHPKLFALTSISTSMAENNLKDMFNQLSATFLNSKVFVFGSVINKYRNPFPQNFISINDTLQFVEKISSIEKLV